MTKSLAFFGFKEHIPGENIYFPHPEVFSSSACVKQLLKLREAPCCSSINPTNLTCNSI